MTSDSESKLWAHLTAAGLIADAVPVRLGGGNLDRDPRFARSSWRAIRPTGEPIKLTVGRHLAAYFERTSAFARRFPEIAPAILFHEQIGGTEAVGETFVEGRSLDALLGEETPALGELARVVSLLASRLSSQMRVSTESARADEWSALQSSILSLPCWDPGYRRLLQTEVLPPLQRAVTWAEPRIAFAHGDFAGRNILVTAGAPGADGAAPSRFASQPVGGVTSPRFDRASLIDAEFAGETHFSFVDAARFYALTPRVELIEPLLASALPRPDAAAFLLFWLQQVQREVSLNRPEYVGRWLPARLAEIRRLAAELAGGAVSDGGRRSVAAVDVRGADGAAPSIDTAQIGAPVEYVVEDARWLIDSPTDGLRIAGWCHALNSSHPLAAIELISDDPSPEPVRRTTMEGAAPPAPRPPSGRILASSTPLARPDVRDHFSTERALLTGFELLSPPVDPRAELSLVAVLASGERHRFWRSRADTLPGRGPVLCGYTAWAELFDPDPSGEPSTVTGDVLFSILLPVFNTDPGMLRACVDSIRCQHYADWELVIVDDASTAPHVPGLLRELAAAEPRIRITSRASNGGIARTTNDALELARGAFVVFVDHDDVLRPHALADIARTLEVSPQLDAVYSDEDKIDVTGRRIRPMFKPAFSPEYLRGVMYIGHVLCVRTTIARTVGGFDPAYDGVQDYDFMLRVSETTTRIGHIPRVLYHWRQSPTSSALHGNVKGDMDRKQRDAVESHLRRTHQPRTAIALGGHRLQLTANTNVRADISVVRFSTAETPLEKLRSAARTDTAEFLLLLSDACADPSDEQQRELAALAQLPDSACVAPVLLTDNSHIAESGQIRTSTGLQPAMRGFDAIGDGYNGSLLCNREVSGVSPECVMVRRALALSHAAGAQSWDEFCQRLLDAQTFHRVCAAVRISTQRTRQPILEGAAPSAPRPITAATERRPPLAEQSHDPFYNPHFDEPPRDYWLTRRPANGLANVGRALCPTSGHSGDKPRPTGSSDYIVGRLECDFFGPESAGCVALRGWAFHREGRPLTVRIVAGPIELTTPVGENRIDVRNTYPVLTDGRCGFSARFRVPNGDHRFSVEAVADDGTRALLGERLIRVTHSGPFSRWWRGSAPELLRFQLFAGPSGPAQAIVREKFPRPRPAEAPRLSIVTPSFQQAHYLRETLGSVLGQPVSCDYVVQDGGSTDGSIEVIRDHESRLHAWVSESDNGQADAIAKAFAKTQGRPDDLMAWINSDDFYLPGALGYVADYFARHPEVDVIYGHRVLVDENSQEIGRWFLPPHDDEVLKLNDFVPQETMFWRRRIWDKAGGIDPSFKFAMDWDLLLRFQAAGARIVRVPYFLACFRIHSAQKTSAQMEAVGQKEIDALRRRTFGRVLPPEEIENHPRLVRYLRKSAWIEFLWRRFGIRSR